MDAHNLETQMKREELCWQLNKGQVHPDSRGNVKVGRQRTSLGRNDMKNNFLNVQVHGSTLNQNRNRKTCRSEKPLSKTTEFYLSPAGDLGR